MEFDDNCAGYGTGFEPVEQVAGRMLDDMFEEIDALQARQDAESIREPI